MQDIKRIQDDFSSQISTVKSLAELEELRISFLGKKGLVTALFSDLRNLSVEEKKQVGPKLNELKNAITQSLQEKKEVFELDELNEKLKTEKIDLTIPVREEEKGLVHPISQVLREIKQILKDLGFEMADGPEIEDDFHNFSALNIGKDHPARQMQDTFYLPDSKDGKKMLLRTHASAVQIRKMLTHKPPLKMASMGKVYRHDSDQTHTPMFHQIEGLVVDKDINMGHLKWTLEQFLKRFFEVDELPMRFRPSFFPFTEPSAEVDIGYSKNNDQIKIGGDENFLEILGCGMVHPQVLKNVG
ncbi:MAG: phenylalanine--tRNA ligase subunit alpha, partial [Proteobacteria bacterium]|nr:phenylalanine--tRNA ligase subunit alpha [Pseudomonadota bacterium]